MSASELVTHAVSWCAIIGALWLGVSFGAESTRPRVADFVVGGILGGILGALAGLFVALIVSIVVWIAAWPARW